MSSSSPTLESSSHFKSILDAALGEYKTKTGNDLPTNSLAKELQACKSAEAVLDVIQREAKAFDNFREGDKRLMKWIGPSVDVLYTISATVGQGVGMVFPAANVVSAGIGVLLFAAKDVKASHDVLVDLFERIQFFLKRLGVHTRITPTNDIVEVLVKIMVEVLSILSIATKEVQQSRTKTYLKRLVGRTDIEEALKRLDDLTREEVQLAIAQILNATKELKDDATRASGAMKQIGKTMDKINDDVGKLKDDVGKIKDDVGKIKDDAGKIKDGVVEIAWNQIEENIRKWLSPPDPSVNYNAATEAYHEGTTTWFFESGIFKEWELIGSLLWIHGKPGAGKSIICSMIIKHAISLRDAKHASLAYFFFDFRDEKKRSFRDFLASLLIQFSTHLPPCREIISHIYSTHGKGTQQPSIDVLTICLHKMLFLAAQQPIYIIIDALDECPNISGRPTPRAVVLKFLKTLVDLRVPNLHICVTSRPEIDIKTVLEPLVYSAVSLHDESGQKEDISNYVNTAVYSDETMARWRDEDKRLVVQTLCENADGMFRWVYCQLEVLQHCFGSSIRQTLDQLPETLDDTYARVLSQIPHMNRANAHRMLQCLMVAVRPLRVEELAELLAFEFGTARAAVPKYRADWRPNDQVHAVQSTCSSLISIVDDNDSQIVQFSHFSVKEFLMSNRLTSSLGDFSQYQILPRPAHTILAQACLGYLFHFDGHVDEGIVKGFPLAEYAAEHWVTHAQFEDVASDIKDGMGTLFDCDKPHFATWLRIYNMDRESSPESPSKVPTPLYYSSLCGFSDMTEHLSTKRPEHVNAIGGMYKFPLLAALVGKHIQVAEILLKHGANVDIRGLGERTPLHEAIIGRCVSIVQSLLDKGVDVNSRQDDHRTPLHLAAYYGELKVARVLIEHKADVDSRDKEGKTPLYLLLEVGSHDDDDIRDLARFLLEHRTDINIRTTNEWTLLHEAACKWKLEIVRLLLDCGANPNVENDEGDTPLHLVSRSWQYHPQERGAGIVRLLLEHSVDVDAREKNGWTSLHWAAFTWRVEIAQVLLDHGANAKLQAERGETALHVVSRGKHNNSQEEGVGTARLLLERGADVNAWDKDGWTSLHFAALEGRVEVAQVLLDHGANAKLETEGGETALLTVSQGEFDSQEQGASTARLLLERGADVNARYKDGWTSLHWAAFKGRVEVTRVLLDHGVNTKLQNERGETALHVVSRGKHNNSQEGVGTARLLLERGVDVNARDKDGWTSLHFAAFEGRVEVSQVLLDYGANAKLETMWGETALHLVSPGEYDSEERGVGIARMLLEHGVDVHAQNKADATALHLAAFSGRLEIVQLLLDHSSNPNAENEEGRTPLDSVTRGKYKSPEHGVSIARLLLELGVNVNAQENNRFTPLHWATFYGKLEVVQVLLDSGANANAENNEGKTPLHLVSQGDYDSQERGVGIARLFLQRSVDVHARDKVHDTPLHSAAFSGMPEIARVLLDHGANVNAENKSGRTPLHQVAQGEYDSQERGVGVARLFLERGVDVQAQDKDHDTALHAAAFTGRLEIVKLFINNGANTTAENDHGEIPLHLVSRGQYVSQENGVGIVQLLLEHDVDINATDMHQNTSLHSASSLGRLEIARVLLDRGAKPGPENDLAQTPLHLVSQGSYWSQDDGVGVAKLLLERGADMHAQDGDYATPLHLACYRGRFDIARVLLEYDAKAQVENDENAVPSPSQGTDMDARNEDK